LKRHQPHSTLALHLSDLHFKPETFKDDAEQRALRHVEAAIAGALAGRRPDLILVTGDLIDSGDWDAAVHLETLKNAKNFLIALCAKFGVETDGLAVVGGNHDFRYRGIAKGGFWGKKRADFYERMQHNFETVFPDFNRHRLYGEEMRLLVACFDSNGTRGPLEFATGVADIEQADAIESNLLRLKPDEIPHRRIALIHHHPLPVPASEILDPQHLLERTVGRVVEGAPEMMLLRNAGVFLQRLLNLDFSLVLHGHLHRPHYWGPLYGVKDRRRCLEVISGASLCPVDGRRGFGLLELFDDGSASYVNHWATKEGLQGSDAPLLSVAYDRVRQRLVERLFADARPKFRCSRIHKVWEVTLPEGDVTTTEVFDGLHPVGENPTALLEIESWASALTRQTFEAAVIGTGPTVSVDREQVKKPNDPNDWIKYTLRFNRDLSSKEPIKLVCQRRTAGAFFSSRDAQRLWGFPSSQLGHDISTHTVWIPCDELLISLRFVGRGPDGVELLVNDPDGKPVEAEQSYWRRWAAYADGHDVKHPGRLFAGPQLTLAIQSPLPRCCYRLKWHVPQSENIPNFQALTNIRRQLLRLRDNSDRNEAKVAREFLEYCVDQTRREIQTHSPFADTDPKLIACLFTVATSTMNDDEVKPRGAMMKCVASTVLESSLACTELPWGRDIVGRAARRGVVASYDRSQLQYAVEVTHKLPNSIQFLLAYPLYCYEPDGYPSAVVALSTTNADSGLGALTRLVDTDKGTAGLLAPVQSAWLEKFTKILSVAGSASGAQ
jgi:predicted MPP superfamily phosphohydrolase